jgi:choline dehydrogenase-like flavoprotein
MKYDVCIIGSGAGGSPVAFQLSEAGYNVVVLEKGPWITTEKFTKDEKTVTRKQAYIPNLKDEFHVTVRKNNKGEWIEKSTQEINTNLWNGNMVGGSSNLMSGYFHRLKPNDFKLQSTYGTIEGATVEDWPITYNDLEPYYTKVEEVVGVSGEITHHIAQEPRSTENFPYPKLSENYVVDLIDEAAASIGVSTFPVARAILSQPKEDRKSCYYSNFCGSYGCSSDAKGSGRAALLNKVAKNGKCNIIPQAKVYHLETNGKGKVVKANYYDSLGEKQFVVAEIFVVAAQAVETSRLLLMSKNLEFPNGLANNNGQVGKNLLFSAGGVGTGYLEYANYSKEIAEKLAQQGVFVNRSSQQWYEIEDEQWNNKTIKGGTIDYLWEHSNPINKAVSQKWDGSRLVFGSELKTNIHDYFTKGRKLKFELFADWLPNPNCFVELDNEHKDKWGDPVAKVWLGNHPHDVEVGNYLAKKAALIFEKMGAKDIQWNISGAPSTNLMAGGCRFGNDPTTSVLDKNCKAHEVDNLYVTDGSFMPTGGSVTYTWTIYANAFRVADLIKDRLSSK